LHPRRLLSRVSRSLSWLAREGINKGVSVVGQHAFEFGFERSQRRDVRLNPIAFMRGQVAYCKAGPRSSNTSRLRDRSLGQSEDNRQFPGGLTQIPIGRLVGWRREAPGAA
jgi:hypothetical protein